MTMMQCLTSIHIWVVTKPYDTVDQNGLERTPIPADRRAAPTVFRQARTPMKWGSTPAKWRTTTGDGARRATGDVAFL